MPAKGAELSAPVQTDSGPDVLIVGGGVIGLSIGWRAAQQAGTARCDVSATEVKGLIVGCQAMQTYSSDSPERLVDVVFDGLRARPRP